jgi:branched-chain amino acid transport system permease protein
MAFFDIYLLEAVINGVLLGGVLALLALGLNLIFGVIDVVWICYAELVMVGMYTIYWLHQAGVPIALAGLASIAVVALGGAVMHRLLIAPILNTPPINQLLVTGGMLFFLQGLATLLFATEFRNLGLHMPIIEVGGVFISMARLLAFGTALIGAGSLFWFLKRTFIGRAIRAVSQDRQVMVLMGVDTRKIYLVTSAIGGGLAGLSAILLSLQYDVHPFVGLQFGPITFIICVLGGLGNMLGGLVASLIISEIISIGGYFSSVELSYSIAFGLFILVMFVRPEGIFKKN